MALNVEIFERIFQAGHRARHPPREVYPLWVPRSVYRIRAFWLTAVTFNSLSHCHRIRTTNLWLGVSHGTICVSAIHRYLEHSTGRQFEAACAQKAAAKLSSSREGIEATFPVSAPEQPDEAPTATMSATSAAPAAQESATVTETSAGAAGQPAAPTWSHEDESSFRALLARRKASGVRRPPNGGTQLLQPGSIKPNAGTAVAVIVELVAGREPMSRAELVKAMASATFTHPKARPTDPSWCQGYVAGAIRSGFLAVVDVAGMSEPERSSNEAFDTSSAQMEA